MFKQPIDCCRVHPRYKNWPPHHNLVIKLPLKGTHCSTHAVNDIMEFTNIAHCKHHYSCTSNYISSSVREVEVNRVVHNGILIFLQTSHSPFGLTQFTSKWKLRHIMAPTLASECLTVWQFSVCRLFCFCFRKQRFPRPPVLAFVSWQLACLPTFFCVHPHVPLLLPSFFRFARGKTPECPWLWELSCVTLVFHWGCFHCLGICFQTLGWSW